MESLPVVEGKTARRRLSRIAIVGCGAVTEKLHLPALAESSVLRVTALVDVDEVRARQMAETFGIPHVATDIAGLADKADIAVIATPHHFHARLAVAAMEAGLHAFVEKPLAPSMEDVNVMLQAAARWGKRVGVGLVRRQYPSFKFAQEVLRSGLVGEIQSFDFREGGVYNWPLASDAAFQRRLYGGVLHDQGAHTLDMLLAWLGHFRQVSYTDDSRGGVEANCVLDLTLASGVKGTIEMSRTRNLRGTCIVRGERGELEIGTSPRGPVTVRVHGTELSGSPRLLLESRDAAPEDPRANLFEGARLQLQRFAEAIENATDTPEFAEHSLESIRLLDACRANPGSIDLPWEPFQAPFDFEQLAGKTVAILGATGFVGGRLVEVLALNSTARIKVLARSFGRLSGVSRFNVEVIPGDVHDRASLAKIMAGADVVVNCTWGRGSREESAKTNVNAVQVLIEEAARAKCRVVHLSTIVAYGLTPDGVLTEEAPARPPKDHVYSYTKWQGNRVALETARRLAVDVRTLLPTAIYGPGAPSWTVNPLGLMKWSVIPLVNGGDGLCNHIYVDDMVLLILCAATSDQGGGELYFANGPEPSPWRDFYGAYEAMLGMQSTVPMSLEEIATARRRLERGLTTTAQLKSLVLDDTVQRRLRRLPAVQAAKGRVPRGLVEAAKGMLRQGPPTGPAGTAAPAKKPLHVPADFDARYQAAKTHISIAKARRLLGYRPVFELDNGMTMTEKWARWANLLP